VSRTDADRLREAIVEIRRLRAQVADAAAPVAVIGAGCRIHGGADTPEQFWQLLLEGRDLMVETPRERWDPASWPMDTHRGGYLDNLAMFDPGFFGITDREARGMDPQQRLLLETAWEALESAAQAPSRLENSRTGVFFALNNNEYFQMAMEGDPARLDPYSISGGVHSTGAGRVAYLLGLRGPAMSVDTACSSSLTAAHLAVQSLRTRECTMALAGGVHLTLRPHLTVGLSRLRMMAPDGRCKVFDESADGFVQGEGCVVVVMKLLADAVRDGDPILAVIRGSAVNQDGRSSGLTAPSGPAQEDVIRAAVTQSGVDPSCVGFVEAHGTGTALGDPLEARALSAVYCAEARREPLWLGAMKSAFGHLGPASGLAGLLKLLWCLRTGELPPNLHVRKPSPHIDWDGAQLALPLARTAWTSEESRVGGVSSFGFSGTNVHMVVEEYRAEVEESDGERLLAVSARNAEALRELTARYIDYLETTADSWAAICYTAGAGRDHGAHRIAVTAGSAREAARKLRAGEYLAGVVSSHPAPKLCWIVADEADAERWRAAGFEADSVQGPARIAAAFGASSVKCAPEGAVVVDCREPVDVARLYVAGFTGNWGTPVRKVRLPNSVFQRRRFWGFDDAWEIGESYLSEHRIGHEAVLPGAWFVTRGLERAEAIRNVVFQRRVKLDVAVTIEAHESAGRWIFRSGDDVASFEVAERGTAGPMWTPSGPVLASAEEHIARAERLDVQIGPAFRAIAEIRGGGREYFARIVRPACPLDDEAWHPAILDACLQVCGYLADGTWIPAAIDRVTSFAPAPDEFWCRAELVDSGDGVMRANLDCRGTDGRPLLSIEGAVFRRERRDWFYAIEWEASQLGGRRSGPAPLVCEGERSVAELQVLLGGIEGERDIWFVAQRASGEWWGLCSTIGPEHPELRVRRAEGPAQQCRALMERESTEDEFVWRGGQWQSPRLKPISVNGDWRPRADGSYLITGGTGGIGMAVAESLLSRGAGRVVLASRRPPQTALPAGMDWVEADVSREADVARAISACRGLRGVFHAAGVVRDGLFLRMSDEDWRAVIAPKLEGARHLDRLTRGMALDCFVLFSSISAYMGAAGQANYAAANAGLDALAGSRRAAGLPALSVNWGAWGGVGMAAAMGETGARRLEQLGIEAMPPAQACDALWRAMASGRPQITVMPPVKWERLIAKLYPHGAPSRLRGFVREQASVAAAVAGENGGVVERVQRIAAGIMGSAPELDRPLLSAGFDSLMAMEMRAALSKSMGVNVPVSRFLTGATIRELAAECGRLEPQVERERFEI
jgi:3-oxoacyl-(acyl-carrier-protein) synthase/NAD(P)-dependent dehydrogenase (short-subunit alcohol dehydrogenase family)